MDSLRYLLEESYKGHLLFIRYFTRDFKVEGRGGKREEDYQKRKGSSYAWVGVNDSPASVKHFVSLSSQCTAQIWSSSSAHIFISFVQFFGGWLD